MAGYNSENPGVLKVLIKNGAEESSNGSKGVSQ